METKTVLLTLLSAATSLQGIGAEKNQGQRPNIIFILADDLGYGDLGCYPHLDKVTTPNLDKLAASGVRMTQAYAAFPYCSPTRASLLTGKFPQHLGVYSMKGGMVPGIGPYRKSFASTLHQFGYRTAWFGKWHLGYDLSNHPLNNGFDVAYGFLGGMHDYWKPNIGDHYYGGPYASHAYVFDGFKPVKKMDYLTDELTERAIAFIKESATKQPFCIYLPYNAPHTPLQAPDGALLRRAKEGWDPIQAAWRAMIDVLDADIGKLMAALKKMDLDQNTLIIFTSDNGGQLESFNGGLRGMKGTVWEGGVRVPLVAVWPGKIPAGSTSGTICISPDITATILAAAGAYGKGDVYDGVDLMPFWTGEKKGDAHETLMWTVLENNTGEAVTSNNAGMFAMRKGEWKIVQDKKKKIDALYNLKSDPGELTDLSKQEPQRKAELLRYGDQFLKGCPPKSDWTYSQSTLGKDRQWRQENAERCEKLLQKDQNKQK